MQLIRSTIGSESSWNSTPLPRKSCRKRSGLRVPTLFTEVTPPKRNFSGKRSCDQQRKVDAVVEVAFD